MVYFTGRHRVSSCKLLNVFDRKALCSSKKDAHKRGHDRWEYTIRCKPCWGFCFGVLNNVTMINNMLLLHLHQLNLDANLWHCRCLAEVWPNRLYKRLCSFLVVSWNFPSLFITVCFCAIFQLKKGEKQKRTACVSSGGGSGDIQRETTLQAVQPASINFCTLHGSFKATSCHFSTLKW